MPACVERMQAPAGGISVGSAGVDADSPGRDESEGDQREQRLAEQEEFLAERGHWQGVGCRSRGRGAAAVFRAEFDRLRALLRPDSRRLPSLARQQGRSVIDLGVPC